MEWGLVWDARTGRSDALRHPVRAIYGLARGVRVVYHVLVVLSGILLLSVLAVGTWLSTDD